MREILDFAPEMQGNITGFMQLCLESAGILFEPDGRHSALTDVEKSYARNGMCRVLYEDGGLAGTVAIRPLEAGICELKLFYVHPDMRRRGIGTALLLSAIDYARHAGYRKMRLDTLFRHREAYALYKKYGFYDIGRYNENIHAEIFMEKDLLQTED